jgi:hypothetical protein
VPSRSSESSQPGTPVALTAADIVGALGYVPATEGTTFVLSSAAIIAALGYTPSASGGSSPGTPALTPASFQEYYQAWLLTLPTAPDNLSSGAWWNNNGMPQKLA